jgi:hypothetical protein
MINNNQQRGPIKTCQMIGFPNELKSPSKRGPFNKINRAEENSV